MSQVSVRVISVVRSVISRADHIGVLVVRSRDRAQDLVEYGIAIAVVAVVVLVAMEAMGTGIAAFFTRLLGRFAGLG